jgi:hypothetical protein
MVTTGRIQMVQMSCGSREVAERVTGQTIAHARQEFDEHLNIPSGSVARMNGTTVPAAKESDTPVEPGQLEFVKQTGAKG